MDFIEFKASKEITDNQPLVFPDYEDEITNDEMEDFIDDTKQQREGVSFYRQLDPKNIKHYFKLSNKTRNPKEAVYEDNVLYFGEEDTHTELCDPEDMNFVGFDKFADFEKSVKKFKETLKNFNGSENSLFDAIIYGIIFYKSEGEIIDKEK